MRWANFDCFKYRLCLIIAPVYCRYHSMMDVVQQAIQGGVTAVQLRAKDASTRELLQLGTELKTVLDPHKIPLIINDRLDIALALDASGVHLGQEDMPYLQARNILGPNKIIGLSVSSIAQAQQAEIFDADYLGVGPIFATPSKSDAAAPLGLDQLSAIKKISRHSLVAIGGINQQNFPQVFQAGADGIAVISAICAAQNPKQATAELFVPS